MGFGARGRGDGGGGGGGGGGNGAVWLGPGGEEEDAALLRFENFELTKGWGWRRYRIKNGAPVLGEMQAQMDLVHFSVGSRTKVLKSQF